MTLQLLRASLNPTFHVRRIAGVVVKTPTKIVEDGPELSNVAVHSSSSEVTRTAATEHARVTKIDAGSRAPASDRPYLDDEGNEERLWAKQTT